MERKVYKDLLEWKRSLSRKPLLLQGARQVGKTHCLEEFGRREFKNYHLFDFMEIPSLCKIFDPDLQPKRILRDLGILNDVDIDIKNDLIIFDEIQQCPNALSSLKYFAQKLPEAFIAASGSLLGLGLSTGSFPVGKINRLKLFPMNFEEFLHASGQNKLIDLLNTLSLKNSITEPVHQKIWTQFKYFMITGGLPEVVKTFLKNSAKPVEGFSIVRKLQHQLLKDYIDDISKHSGKIKSVKIEAIFKNVPIQLARETGGIKKFVFKEALPGGARLAVLEAPIEWLIKAGLIIKIPITGKPQFPLQAYSDEKRFKLYLFDVGMLGCMLDLSPKTIFSYNYGSYKGYFAENIALTELTAKLDKKLYSWNRNSSEIEFLMEYRERIIPIEVKAGINKKAKSLRVYIEKYSPENAILFSGHPAISKNDITISLPLYLVSNFQNFL